MPYPPYELTFTCDHLPQATPEPPTLGLSGGRLTVVGQHSIEISLAKTIVHIDIVHNNDAEDIKPRLKLVVTEKST